MSLKLKLKPMERLIVNGCIVRNSTKRRIEIEIENHSDVLRGSEMLDANTADTPVKRVSYMIQIALVSRAHRDEAVSDIKARLMKLREIMKSSHAETIDSVIDLVDGGDFYAANRALQEVVSYEAVLLGISEKRDCEASPSRVSGSRIQEMAS